MFLKLRGPYRLKCIRCDEDEQQNCAIRLRGCSDNQLTPCSYRSQTLKPLGAYTFRFFLSFVNVRIRKPKIINLHLTPKRPQIFKTHRKIRLKVASRMDKPSTRNYFTQFHLITLMF